MEKKLVNRFERINVFSPEEYRRRIEGIREILRRKGLDMAVFLECSEETYAQWMLGVRYLEYIIVPVNGEVTGVLWNEYNEKGLPMPEDPDFDRYFMQKSIDPVCEGIRFINRWPDQDIVDYLASYHPKAIGWVAPGRMTADFASALSRQLPHLDTTDISVDVALFRAVKSEEEFQAIQLSRDTQCKVFEALPLMIREGRTCDEVTFEMRHMLASMGAFGVMSAALMDHGPSDDILSEREEDGSRKIQYGDRLFALFEANGPGGQHVAFGRHLVMGEPSRQMEKAVSDEIKAHRYAASLMKADGTTTLSQIAVKTRKYVNSLGYYLREEVGWNWMHSLGAFIYEQFSVEDYTEDLPLLENTILHCHPMMYSYYEKDGHTIRKEVFILNTYKVTKDGPEDLIRIPFDPVIIE